MKVKHLHQWEFYSTAIGRALNARKYCCSCGATRLSGAIDDTLKSVYTPRPR